MPIFNPPSISLPVPLADLESIAAGTYLGRSAGAGAGAPVALAGPVGGMMPAWQASAIANVTTPTWLVVSGVGTVSVGSVGASRVVLPRPIVVVRMTVLHASASATDSVTYTLQVNDVDTAIVGVIPIGGTKVSATGSVAAAAGDTLSIKAVNSLAIVVSPLGVRASVAWVGGQE